MTCVVEIMLLKANVCTGSHLTHHNYTIERWITENANLKRITNGNACRAYVCSIYVKRITNVNFCSIYWMRFNFKVEYFIFDISV